MSEPTTIELGELGDLPILPPRRVPRDFLPMRLRKWLNIDAPTAYEVWLIKSLLLRTMYSGLYIAECDRAYAPTKAPDKGRAKGDDDPWRWS